MLKQTQLTSILFEYSKADTHRTKSIDIQKDTSAAVIILRHVSMVKPVNPGTSVKEGDGVEKAVYSCGIC